MTRNLLGWNRSSPPVMFVKEGRAVRKQQELVNIQAEYYRDKVLKIKESIPAGDWDPLNTLRQAMDRWKLDRDIPTFHLW